RATWSLIYVDGKEIGWIDKAGLKTLGDKKVVVNDAGHGGHDPGAQSGGVREKDLNLTVSKKVENLLKNNNYYTVMTRRSDIFLELSERASIANNIKADIFVSIYTNSFNGLTSGIETFSYDQKGKPKNPILSNNANRLLRSSALSSSIQNTLASSLNLNKIENRGAKKANFHVLRETHVPAVLVEIGFVDHAAERKKLVNDAYQNKLSTAIVNGIKTYFSQVK